MADIAQKLLFEDVDDFEISSAYEAFLLYKNGRLGYRDFSTNWLLSEDSDGNSSVKGDLKIGGSLDVGDEIFFRNGLIVEGDTWLRDKLRVEEDSVFDGDVYMNANLYVSKNFQLGSDGIIGGDLTVSDSLTVNDLIVTGNAQIDSILDVNNDINVLGDASIGGTLNVTSLTLTNKKTSVDGYTIDASSCSELLIDSIESGISFISLVDRINLSIRNDSGSDATINHDIYLQGNVNISPVKMCHGEVWNLTWDNTNSRFEF